MTGPAVIELGISNLDKGVTPLRQKSRDGRKAKERRGTAPSGAATACLHLVVTKPPLAALLACVGE